MIAFRRDWPWWEARFAELGLAVFLALLPIPRTPSGQNIALGFTGLMLIIRSVRERRLAFRWKPLALPLGLWTAWVAASIPGSQSPAYSLKEFRTLHIMMLLVFLLFSSTIRTPGQVQRMSRVLIGVLLGVVLWQGWLIVSNPEDWELPSLYHRYASYFGHYDQCASYLCLLWPLALAVALGGLGAWRGIGMLAVAGGGTMELLTFSRAGWAAFLGTLVFFGIFWRRRVLAGMLLAGVAAVAALPDVFLDRLRSTALSDRSDLWTAGVRMALDHPWLGVGFGNRNFGRLFPKYLDSSTTEGIMQNSHNLFLQVAVEIGFPGFCLFLAVLATGMIEGFFGWRRLRGGPDEYLYWGLVGGLAAFCTHGLAAYHFVFPDGLLFMALLAMIVGLNQDTSKHELSDPSPSSPAL